MRARNRMRLALSCVGPLGPRGRVSGGRRSPLSAGGTAPQLWHRGARTANPCACTPQCCWWHKQWCGQFCAEHACVGVSVMSRPPALHLPRPRVVATTLHRFQALVGAGRYAETGVEHPAPRQVATLVGMLLLLLRGHGPIVLGCAAALLLDAIAGRF